MEPTLNDLASLRSKNMDHLGIVAQVCKDLGLAQIVDDYITLGPGYKITAGDAVVGMILNSLGFVSQPLYLFPEYLAEKPIDRLIRPKLKAEWFNDDTIGRTLDRLHEVGCGPLFMSIVTSAYQKYGLEHSEFVHIDTSSMSVEGNYPEVGHEIEIKITHGHSKDHRPDLKQFMIGLITNRQIPLFIEALSGNTSDKSYFREVSLSISRHVQELWEEDKVFVFDSAFYSSKNIKAVAGVFNWITSVPKTLSLAKQLLSSIDKTRMNSTSLDGYSTSSQIVNYGDVEQRWVIVFSEKAFLQQEKTVRRQIDKEFQTATNQIWHLSNKTFASAEDAHTALSGLVKKWKYHKPTSVTITEHSKRANGSRGRPRLDEELVTVYSPEATVEQDEEAITEILNQKGKFIVATSFVSKSEYSDEEILVGYKSQQNVEQGFRFLKSPSFFADAVFLKKPSRIMSLVMVMGLALLVYSITEQRLRKTLEDANEPLPDKYRTPTTRPTLRRVFQIFQGITEICGSNGTSFVINIKPIHKFVLEHLGDDYLKMYSLDPV